MADDQGLTPGNGGNGPQTAQLQPQRRPEKGGDAPGQYIGSEVAGRLLMVSGERVRQLSHEGWIRKVGHDQYTLVDVVQGYIRFRDDVERRKAEKNKGDRVVTARARELELRIAEREGKLIDVDECLAIVEELCGLFRTSLSGLPATTTRDLSLRRELEKRCNDICDAIAESALKKVADISAGRQTDANVATDSAASMGNGEPGLSNVGGVSGSA